MATSATLKKRRKWFEANGDRISDYIKPSVVTLSRIGETTPKTIIGPLRKKIGHGTKNGVLIDLPLLEFHCRNLAEPVLIVLKHCSWKELIENLRLASREQHQVLSVLNH
jgi:hypothetical protein